MKDISLMHHLATKYFEGTLSAADEPRLWAFIRESADSMYLFRQWEQEWKASRVPVSGTEEAWKQMRRKLSVKEATENLATDRPSVRRRWWHAVGIAAALILTVAATWGWMAYQWAKVPEAYFVSSAAYGEKSQVTLSDGSRVWLNAGSSLRYPTQFGVSGREVILKGEAYFEVESCRGKEFVVHTDSYDVVVKGTKFNVSAYADETDVVTTLLEGKVEINVGSQVMALAPGQQLSYNRKTASITRSNVEATQAKAWSENRGEYSNITLRELVVKLSRQYNVTIQLDVASGEVAERSFHISLRNGESVDDVLNALQLILPVKVERSGQNILIK